MPDFKIKNLSFEELIKLRAEIETTISNKKYEAYKEAVKKVIEAIEKVVELDPYETAIDTSDYNYGTGEEYTWKDLLERLRDEHY